MVVGEASLFVELFAVELVRRAPCGVALFYKYFAKRHVLYVLHQVATAVGYKATASEMVGVVEICTPSPPLAVA
jgi:hypothetical protein